MRSDEDLIRLRVADVARRIESGTLSSVALVEACLARIAALEPRVRAWVHVDADGALAAAKARDAEARQGHVRGPLHGIPVGIKDIIHVAGIVTTAGARPSAHTRPERDAAAVARLRAAGAVILGKTATTEFAFLDPAPTRNPWNAEHTPGGSSAGSGAAVGGAMVPLALGTQTVGSVLRPAAYCGAVGFKGTHGLVSTDGVLPLAWSFDHVGVMARDVAGVARTLSVLAERLLDTPPDPTAPHVALVPELVDRAQPEVARQVRQAAEAFGRAGACVSEVKLPAAFADLHAAGRAVLEAEAAAAHQARFAVHAAEYGAALRKLVEEGLRRSAVSYVGAIRAIAAFREAMVPILTGHDALLTPTAASPAPRGLGSTGDPFFCAPWSFTGSPAISLPSGLADTGLPHAVQLISTPGNDARLLAVAAWCERVLDFSAVPPD